MVNLDLASGDLNTVRWGKIHKIFNSANNAIELEKKKNKAHKGKEWERVSTAEKTTEDQ